jgi:hypothetical protein
VNKLIKKYGPWGEKSRVIDPYFGIVAGLEWSNDPESYAGSSVCYW